VDQLSRRDEELRKAAWVLLKLEDGWVIEIAEKRQVCLRKFELYNLNGWMMMMVNHPQ